MKLHFYKYQGTGNDFILIDDRQEQFDIGNQPLIERLCHRRFGIGADGLILLRNDPATDFRMVYFNSDGRESSMCGNGGRCIVQFANHLGLFERETTFMAIDGLHDAAVQDGIVSLKMTDVQEVETGNNFFYLNTGSPHYVSFVSGLDKLDVFNEGAKIRYNDRFWREGTNVNFVEQLADGHIFVRTYERGVENETLSCGTGVTAAAIASGLQTGVANTTFTIKTLGGELGVSYETSDRGYANIFLKGAAQKVFEGTIEI